MPPTPWWISVLSILPFKWLLAVVINSFARLFSAVFLHQRLRRGNAPEVIKAENLPTWTNNYRRLFTSIREAGTWPLHVPTSWPVRPLRKGIIECHFLMARGFPFG